LSLLLWLIAAFSDAKSSETLLSVRQSHLMLLLLSGAAQRHEQLVAAAEIGLLCSNLFSSKSVLLG